MTAILRIVLQLYQRKPKRCEATLILFRREEKPMALAPALSGFSSSGGVASPAKRALCGGGKANRIVTARSPMLRFTLLAALILTSACSGSCTTAYTYRNKPEGYEWKEQRAPGTGDVVYYGVDPKTHDTVYVGPDNHYYVLRPGATMTPRTLHSQWCPPDTSKRPFFSSLAISTAQSLRALFSHHDRLSDYNYLRRPTGYHWTAKRDKGTGAIVYYGTDPANGWTVYVGPDGIYYTFNHRGAIQPSDLQSLWDPHSSTQEN
jgi:hypothetical protein